MDALNSIHITDNYINIFNDGQWTYIRTGFDFRSYDSSSFEIMIL